MNLRLRLVLAACLVGSHLCPQIGHCADPRQVDKAPPAGPTQPTVAGEPTTAPPAAGSPERTLAAIFDQLGPLRQHFVGHTRQQLDSHLRERENYAILRKEKLAGGWSAALVSDSPADRWSISERFDTLEKMKRFLREREAVVENWAYTEDRLGGRRLTASESAEWSKRDSRPPTYQTATFMDRDEKRLVRGRLEFGQGAPAESLGAALSYRRDRKLRDRLRSVLSKRGPTGDLSAKAQWEALRREHRSGTIPISEMPPEPQDDCDLLHAFECSTTMDGQISEVLRVYRASEIRPRMIDGLTGIELCPDDGGAPPRTAALFDPSPPRGVGDDNQPIAQGTEVRIRDPDIDDPRLWNRLEFGEPSLLRRQGLANFGLVNAHMEGARKGLAMKKARIDRVAEPVFAGLNIGGGLAGVGAPLGESARLGYNLLLGRKYVPDVPSIDEFRNLYAIYLAKTKDPQLRNTIPAKLSKAEMRRLRSAAARLGDQQINDGLGSVTDDDLAAMLQLPRRQANDQKYRLFGDILTDLAKVTGESQSGIVRDIFDNHRVSLSGELSLTTTLALAFGEEGITPLSGVSLEDLANGDGPAEAWLQYLNVSLDLRAIANTSYLLRKRDEIDRELRKPFAYAPRMSDLAAYEIRIFGYPLLLRYKRGLLEDDIEAYENCYAYGVVGTRIVTRFDTQADFYRELRSGNMAPIGLVRIPERRGLFRSKRVDSNLPVFGYRIPSGEHAGQTAIIIYGMDAHRSYSEQIDREAQRFGQFEEMLETGGTIERLIAAEAPDDLPRSDFEPVILGDREDASERYTKLLSELLEYDRHVKFAAWGIAPTPVEEIAARKTASSLRGLGVDVDPRSSPLIEVADHFGSFVYRKRKNGKWRYFEVVHFPSQQEISKDIGRKTIEAEIQAKKRRAVPSDPLASPARP